MSLSLLRLHPAGSRQLLSNLFHSGVSDKPERVPHVADGWPALAQRQHCIHQGAMSCAHDRCLKLLFVQLIARLIALGGRQQPFLLSASARRLSMMDY
jgi:hypothetical protein